MEKQKELELWKRWKDGDEKARNELLKSLTPLLTSQVNRFTASGLPESSIKTESRRLALEAFKTYDPSKSALNTHIVNHQKHLQRFVLNYQNVGRIPENRGLAISKFENIKRNLMEELGREPSMAEMSKELGWSIKEVDRMDRELRRDLSTASQGEDDYFEDFIFNTDETAEIMQFIYYEASPEEKVILEYLQGLGGKPKLGIKDISFRMGKPEFYIRKKVKDLYNKIIESRENAGY